MEHDAAVQAREQLLPGVCGRIRMQLTITSTRPSPSRLATAIRVPAIVAQSRPSDIHSICIARSATSASFSWNTGLALRRGHGVFTAAIACSLTSNPARDAALGRTCLGNAASTAAGRRHSYRSGGIQLA